MAQQTYTLRAAQRDTNQGVAELRKQDIIPINLYGRGLENQNLQVKLPEFIKVYSQAGESSLIDLHIDGKDAGKILVKDVQLDIVKDRPIHVDMYQINMNETITTEIPLVFTGVAPAVKEMAGILVKQVDRVEVECLPGDLVHEIEVDISSLHDFNDAISIADLQVPEGITILQDATVSVATVAEPRKEEEIEAIPGDEQLVPDSVKEDTEGDDAEGEKKAEGEGGDAEKAEGEEKKEA